MSSDDPTVIRSLAVTAGDVGAALAPNRERSADAVRRAARPFSDRMRARLHRAGMTADADPDIGSDQATHPRHHEAALEGWRADVRAALLDRPTIETPTGPHGVEVAVLD